MMLRRERWSRSDSQERLTTVSAACLWKNREECITETIAISPADPIGRLGDVPQPISKCRLFRIREILDGLDRLGIHAYKRRVKSLVDVAIVEREPVATFHKVDHQFDLSSRIARGFPVFADSLLRLGNLNRLLAKDIRIHAFGDDLLVVGKGVLPKAKPSVHKVLVALRETI